VAAVDEVDEIVVWARGRGPVPLPLDGWDQASIWGWDETTESLYAHLWRNTDNPAKPPPIRIAPDDYTPAITLPETFAQHIAMAVDCSPWKIITVLDDIVDQDEGWDSRTEDPRSCEAGTVVTMTERYGLPEWPYRPQPW
jgi:hypothetical protein